GKGTSFIKTGAGWRAGRFTPTGKRPRAEGPIVEAVSGPHMYVYGWMGAATAAAAAAWSSPRSGTSLKFPVKADTEVTTADLDSYDLVLFGTAQTNSVIARLRANLPLALDPGAADYGLLFIAPVGKQYVLVNSGLAWWTGVDGMEPYRVLSRF